MNHCMFAGNLTRDVEVKTVGDNVVGNFSLAINERYKDKEGNWVDRDPTFLDFELWGDRAKYLAEVTSKGTGLMVYCQAKQDQWKDENDKPRSKVKFRVSDFKLTVIPKRGEKPAKAEQAEEPKAPKQEKGKGLHKKTGGPAAPGEEEIPF